MEKSDHLQDSKVHHDFVEYRDESPSDASRRYSGTDKTTLWQALKTYPAAAAWSIVLSSSIIMEGYDTSLVCSLFAFPQFNSSFGQNSSGEWQLSTAWQTALLNASMVGSIIGLALNGFLCDRIGYKKTFSVFLVFMMAAIFVQFFAPNVIVLTASQFLCGIPWGAFQTLSVAYASECAPTCLRGYLTTYANICWLIGQILAAGVLRGLLGVPGDMSYKIAFAIQWIFPIPILVASLFAPESPRWLVRQGRLEEALKNQRRLMSKFEDEGSVQARVAEMRYTNEQEKSMVAETSYWDCFKGSNLRRTEIACATWSVQNLCGSAFMGYSTYFYEQAGLPVTQAFNFTMIQYVLGFLGVGVAWLFMSRYGRRTIYVTGICILLFILCVIGGLGFASGPSVSWGIGSLLLVFTLVYDCSCGPVCYAIVSEISTTRLRQKTVVLARMTYNTFTIFNYSMMPLMLNPDAFNWGPRTALFWAGVCLLCFICCYFRLPEPKDRSYDELNILFEKGISARKFTSTDVSDYLPDSTVVRKSFAVESTPTSA